MLLSRLVCTPRRSAFLLLRSRAAPFVPAAMSSSAYRVTLELNVDVEAVITAARAAGSVILDVYSQETGWEVEQKADNSPLTRADREANAVICGARAVRLPCRALRSFMTRLPRPHRAAHTHRIRGEYGCAA
jgi:uncharacterized protein (DUF1778 family)